MREHLSLEWGRRLNFRKLALLVSTYELGNNVSYYYFLEKSESFARKFSGPLFCPRFPRRPWPMAVSQRRRIPIPAIYRFFHVYCVSYDRCGVDVFVLVNISLPWCQACSVWLRRVLVQVLFLWVRSHSWRLQALAGSPPHRYRDDVVHAQSKETQKHEFRSRG